jgi:hypothetical protein
MLNAVDFNRVRSSFEEVVATLGVTARLLRTKLPQNSRTSVVGMRTASASSGDEWILNAYGINAVIFTLTVKDFYTAPERFDRIEVSNNIYTVDAVRPVILNGVLVGWKLYCKGLSV